MRLSGLASGYCVLSFRDCAGTGGTVTPAFFFIHAVNEFHSQLDQSCPARWASQTADYVMGDPSSAGMWAALGRRRTVFYPQDIPSGIWETAQAIVSSHYGNRGKAFWHKAGDLGGSAISFASC